MKRSNGDSLKTSDQPLKKKKLNPTEMAESKQNDNGLVLPDLPLSIIFVSGNKGKLREIQSYLGDDLGKYVVNYKIDIDEIQGDCKEILKAKLMEAKKVINENLSAVIKDKNVCILVEDTSLALKHYSKKFDFPGIILMFALSLNYGNKCF